MVFSPPTLHPGVITTDQERDLVRAKIASLAAARPEAVAPPIAAGAPVSIRLTTVSRHGNFDATIQVQFPRSSGGPLQQTLLVDSGNAQMIIPDGEALVGVAGYTVLGQAKEPWGCPANVMRGPVQIVAVDGSVYQIPNCVFYACTGNNQHGKRTANFGTGRISPWSANGWNKPWPGVTMQSPLSYNTAYPYAEFVYAPAAAMLSATEKVLVNDGSMLILRSAAPSGFTMLDIIQNLEWMSVVPASLAIGGTATGWPGNVSAPIAMIDTGGGPVFLSDPNGYVYAKKWPDTVTCPAWTSSSQSCNCISERLQLGLKASGGAASYGYTIDTNAMPPSVRGLTAVMCKVNAFMMHRQGMNVGGITALFNRILIDYAGTKVGLAPKYANWTQTVEMGSSVDQQVAAQPPGVLIGYDFYPPGSVVNTTMTISWTGLPAGATLYVQHGGSDGAEVLKWNGPDTSTAANGKLTASFTIKRTTGAAVPLFIYAFKDNYLPLNFHITATSS
jgi:hypothetical protein